MADSLYSFEVDGLDNVLEVVRFNGSEAISQLSRFEFTLACSDPNIDFSAVVGQPATFTMRIGDTPRHVHGIVLGFELGEMAKKNAYYRATLVPELWSAHQKQSFRIFQFKTAVEIIEDVLNDLSLTASDFRTSLSGSYEQREYCVQYRESDWHFISRLMEEEGISCFFEHVEGNHTLVLADSTSAYEPIPGEAAVIFRSHAGALAASEHVNGLRYREGMRPDKVTLRDYNFKTPQVDLESDADGSGGTAIEVYDYPGDYEVAGVGSKLAQQRMEEWEVDAKMGSMSSTCVRFKPGHTFELSEHPRDDFNHSWTLLRVEHRGAQPDMTESTSVDENYANDCVCIPGDVPYRPPHLTSKPTIKGVQTAIVTGPSGEEIYTDEHGRIKVQFHWDREGKKDENSSCWIRVNQVWAGPGWGGLYIPRIGQEVVVEFLEGDPDRPLVTGAVYHGSNVPPYVLPDDKTKSTLKSNSSLGGDGFNEFRFEDLKDKEEIYLHGQKDWTIGIENDKNQEVGHDETLDVGNDRSKQVGRDQSEKVGQDKTIGVGRDHREKIGASETIKIGKDAKLAIGGDRTIKVGGDQTVEIGKNEKLEVGGNRGIGVGEGMTLTVGKKLAQEVGEGATLTVGKDNDVTIDGSYNVTVGKDLSTAVEGDGQLDVGKEHSVTIGDKFSLEVGDGKVTVESDGTVTVEGKDINIKGSGTINVEGEKIQIKSKGAVDLKADGDVKVKGSGVELN